MDTGSPTRTCATKTPDPADKEGANRLKLDLNGCTGHRADGGDAQTSDHRPGRIPGWLPKNRRRQFLATTTAATALVAMPFVRGAHAAGKLSMGFWDHWVPGANNATKTLVDEWAAKEKVDVKIDFITSQGNKLLLTIAAESQAQSGHDILAISTWIPNDHASRLERVDDVMEPLIKQNGAVNPTVEYLGKAGRPLDRGARHGRQPDQGAVLAHRPDEAARRHRRAGDVSGRRPAEGRQLDPRRLPEGGRGLPQGRRPFGIGLGTTADSVDTAGAIFHSFGAMLVDAKGNITVKSDPGAPGAGLLRAAGKVLPAGRAGLGRFLQQQVAGVRPWRADHEPAERLGGRQARRAAGRGAMLDPRLPGRSEGPLRAVPAVFLGIWNFSKNKSAAKSLLAHLSQASSAEKMVVASGGYDLPSFANLTNFKTWAEEGPPKGTLYHYPNPHKHQILSIAAAPAPPKIAVQIYIQGLMTKMTVRHLQGEAMEKTLAWAEGELEGFMRT